VQVADASVEDALAALAAAADAQAEWAAHPPRERGEILRRAYEAIVEQTEELALLMTLEMGKPLKESRAEITYAPSSSAGSPRRPCASRPLHGQHHRQGPHPDDAPAGRAVRVRHAVELPLAMGTRKIAPAIAAGCTMVVKPASRRRCRCSRWRRSSRRPGCRAACST
jgi:succinate-semialdehyde dehydrogenase/glutarate-semialdehyde dehydrogenase